MNNLIILPIVIPFLMGILLIFFNKHITVQKWLSAAASFLSVIASIVIVQTVHTNGIQTLEIGNWAPPYGIVLVADMYASLLVLTTSIIGFTSLLFAFSSVTRDREKFYFYPGVQFLLLGVTGAFLTGDIFNLFVFFEVMLMSSYLLIVLGSSKNQLRESIKYILVNVISSALFVIAVAYLYAVTGTLNMADLSVRIADMGQSGLLTVIAILFLVIFGLKGAIFPLYFWLPASYQAPPAVVTALFGALLTKVGVYSITRVYSVIFYHEPSFTHQILAWLSALTIVFGVIGAIAYWDIKKIVIYNIITAVGVILFGIAANTPNSVEGSIYYLVHDMIVKGALFFLVGTIIAITGTSNLRKFSGLIASHPFLGWMFLIATLALAGIPPLSGFIGKLKIIQGGFEAGEYTIAFVVLLSSLLVLYSVMKIFIHGFWGEPNKIPVNKEATKGLILPIVILLVLSIAYGFGVESLSPYISQAADTLLDPSIYIQAVLKE
ncbi:MULTISPECIES: Na+/H+ antiporter subunit D [Bacillaceae]|uniref:Na+/H+ antiporter subunit D n=1 Tax=Bacillaceae TaxID=186817 RepID=UPI000BFBFB85|nr:MULTISPECIES: Na+/H+ antiporter subunit D [Bacillaceae]PGT89281.1 Na+/H+ antiporter subunit D [Bacillus sp. AFS040349]UGB30070.1 Na+/H+ antiporter subunit D [Metabacillus sp. B2-18]